MRCSISPRASTLNVLITLAGCLTIGITMPLLAQTPRQVVIRGSDYAFQSPDTIRRGLALFTFENQGTVRHELVVSRLKEGHSLAELMAAKTAAERQVALDALVGLVIAEPGKVALGRLLSTMEKGRTYILMCNLRDVPDKQTHLAQGMGRLLHVR